MLLHLDAGANRSGESVSRELTARFARAWRAAHPDASYRHRDLAAEPVAPIDTTYCTLGRRLEREGTVVPAAVADRLVSEDERRAWALTRPLIDELRAADVVVIGAPMYNYAVSSTLKAWIDRVTFPGAFLEADGGRQALRGTRVVVVTASGGAYGPGSPREGWDFQTPYLRAYFGEHGVRANDLVFAAAELTLAPLVDYLAHLRPTAAQSLAAARAAVDALADAPVATG